MIRYVVPMTLAVAAALFFAARNLRFERDASAHSESSIPVSEDASSTSATGTSVPVRTRSKNRPIQRKPTIQETMAILRNTMIAVVDLPEQSIADRVEALNRLIRKAGVEPHEFRVVCGKMRKPPDAIVPSLKVTDVPFGRLLIYSCNASTVPFIVRPGFAELTNLDDPRYELGPAPDGQLHPHRIIASGFERVLGPDLTSPHPNPPFSP
jgi:hypothetical protein